MTSGIGMLRYKLLNNGISINFLSLSKLYFSITGKDSLGWKIFEVPKSCVVFLPFLLIVVVPF